jgi:hypothetical protein
MFVFDIIEIKRRYNLLAGMGGTCGLEPAL